MPKVRLINTMSSSVNRSTENRAWPHDAVWPLVAARCSAGSPHSILDALKSVLEELDAGLTTEFADGRCVEITSFGVALMPN